MLFFHSNQSMAKANHLGVIQRVIVTETIVAMVKKISIIFFTLLALVKWKWGLCCVQFALLMWWNLWLPVEWLHIWLAGCLRDYKAYGETLKALETLPRGRVYKQNTHTHPHRAFQQPFISLLVALLPCPIYIWQMSDVLSEEHVDVAENLMWT